MSASVFGIPIEGLERDFSLELDMGLASSEVIGKAPIRLAYTPADGSLDYFEGDTTLWLHTAAAAALEGAVQPYGGADGGFYLPEILNGIAIPGIAGVASGTGYRTISNVLIETFESQGRKAVGTDLFGYRFSLRIPCDTTNETFSAVVPDIVAHKFGAHQIQDWSKQILGSVAANDVRSWAAGVARRHGRRWDGNVDCDHCTYEDAQAIVQWARAVRGDAVAFPSYAYGPTFAGETIYVKINKLTLARTNGLFWQVKIETSLYSATATTPIFWSVVPSKIVSGAAANVVIYGSGFDAATTVTVGGVACTVTSWTSGRLYVTVPAGVAGQYEVVLTNAAGSSTGTLWRYDAGEISFGSGGSIVATTAVSGSKNQLVGLNSSGNVVLADSILGIVAVGYAATNFSAGDALTVYQTGEATPVSGLSDGQQVYLGAAGSYVSAPPSGATIVQQVGIATSTGVAVNCGDAVAYRDP